ncbi:Glutathione S-transferase 2 [Trametes pubescens]|uniref:Glutathione S-transferase 2 n=1 Tax=Trametes pubescens TaxID=154538 RepID=A0A1M2W5W7_TRAPU|nr:Glutathione S-transferase 2 [Trametes pubescens]
MPQFTLYMSNTGTNGWKVAMVLEELDLQYHAIFLDLSKGDQRNSEHTKFNPNGRIPTLIDHENNDFTIWESNAIVTYLVEKYDLDAKVSLKTFEGKITQLQWLMFQASGQGPYFGQAVWFIRSHPEKIPSAVVRYQKEVLRVFGVLEIVLSKQEWLVEGKYTVADLSFIPWTIAAVDGIIMRGYEGFDFAKDFPSVSKWHQAMLNRPAVKKVDDLRKSMMPVDA